MTSEFRNISAARNFKTALNMHLNNGNSQKTFCNQDNLGESLIALSEELESLNILPSASINNIELESIQSLKELSTNFANILWKLIHKYRILMKSHSELNDNCTRISNDNTNLKNHVKRLKEELQKKKVALSQVEERERKLKTQYASITHDLKQEKSEVIKLRKQFISKDIQHQHEIRRIMQNGHKVREQLQKQIANHIPKNRVFQKTQGDYNREVTLYKQQICRLEEDNNFMRKQIDELKNALALHSAGIELQIEASGVWSNIET